MLYDEGECHPLNKGYSFKLYLENRIWKVIVYYKDEVLDEYTTEMSYNMKGGMDAIDAREIDKRIENIIKKHLNKGKK